MWWKYIDFIPITVLSWHDGSFALPLTSQYVYFLMYMSDKKYGVEGFSTALCNCKLSHCASNLCLTVTYICMLHIFLSSTLSLTVHGLAATQPAPIYLWLWLRGPSVSSHHAQCGSTHHADHQIHRILQEHLHTPREQCVCHCGLLWRWTGLWVNVCVCKVTVIHITW